MWCGVACCHMLNCSLVAVHMIANILLLQIQTICNLVTDITKNCQPFKISHAMIGDRYTSITLHLMTFSATEMECGKLNDSMWGTRAMFLLTLAKSVDLRVKNIKMPLVKGSVRLM